MGPINDPGSLMPMQEPGSWLPMQAFEPLGLFGAHNFGAHLGPFWGPFYLGPIGGHFYLFGTHWDPFEGH